MTVVFRLASRHWLVQPLTAAVMGAYSLLALALVFAAAPFSYDAWQSLFGNPWMGSSTILFSVCLGWHAAIGIHDILRDYVKAHWPRAVLLALSYFVLIGLVVKTGSIFWS